MKITIVIPTYNEAENIEPICREIFSACGSAAGGKYSNNINIIIVDDNSRDNTEKIANSLIQNNNHIKFISRKNKTRSFAQSYIEGFHIALKSDTDYIIQMDADFSHNPQYLPEIIDSLKNYDVVIGSRYVTSGKIENWSLVRKLISRGGSIYTQIIAGLPVSDSTAGFVGWRKQAMQKINLDKIKSNGYAFQIEMKFNAYINNLKIKEIPITFVDRKFGASKMSRKIVLEAILFCWKLNPFFNRNR